MRKKNFVVVNSEEEYKKLLQNNGNEKFELVYPHVVTIKNQYNCIYKEEKDPFNANGYEYVDLGLPSGTLWAKCDYGADSETADGLYFSRLNSTTGLPSSQIPDDVPAGMSSNTVVASNVDAIPKLMGGDWCMPENKDIQELIDYADYEYAEIKGAGGTRVMNRSDHSKYIFFPYSTYNGAYVCWLNDVYTHGDNTTNPSRFFTMFDSYKPGNVFMHIGYQSFGARANRYRGIIRKK